MIEDVGRYLEYLNGEAGLAVTVHFCREIWEQIPAAWAEVLLRYNVHGHPYCMAVKADRARHEVCMGVQHALYGAERQSEGWVHTCPWGVSEYLMPICEEGQTVGLIAVSGHRPSEPPAGVIQKSVWAESLRGDPLPVATCHALLPPLRVMLQTLLAGRSREGTGEYILLLQYLREHHTDVTLEELCRHLYKSRSYVSRLFNESSGGLSIRAYCNRLKLEDARHLLLTTSMSVTEVALEAGFRDVSYFVKLFKERYGASPHRYRRAR